MVTSGCAKVNCSNKKNLSNTLTVRCCGSKAAPVAPKPKSQGQKDMEEFVRGKNPSKSDRNTKEDTRNVLEKVSQEGEKAGGRPGGTPDDPDGSGTGDSGPCSGCDTAGDIGCEIGKFSCEITSSLGANLPLLAIGGLAVVVLIIVLK